MPASRLRLLALSALIIYAAATSAGQSVQVLDLQATLPDNWIAETPTSDMRKLQYRIPGASEDQAAELVVYYFGMNQGGTLEANIERWKSQFSRPDGGEVEPVIEQIDGSSMPATLVTIQGSYARGLGVGPQGEALPDRTLLAALVQTPEGTLYPQMHGPAATVSAAREGFIGFIRSLAPSASPAPAEKPANETGSAFAAQQ